MEPDFHIIGQAATGVEGLALIRAQRPDVAVLDVNLPDLSGLQITRQVNAERLPTKILLLTAYGDHEQQVYALRAGAMAYCTKDVEPAVLVTAIRKVLDGVFVLGDNELRALALERLLAGGAGEPLEALTPREMEVLAYLTQGKSNKEIGVALKISRQTVKNHVTAILRKLQVDDRTQAALYALRRGGVRFNQDGFNIQE